MRRPRSPLVFATAALLALAAADGGGDVAAAPPDGAAACAVGDDVRGYSLVERVRLLGLPTFVALPPPARAAGGVVLASPPACAAAAPAGGEPGVVGGGGGVCNPAAEAVAPSDAAGGGPGGYSLHASVGRGHAGEVWRATGPDGGAYVLKRLLARSPAAVASGRREAALGSRTVGLPGVARFVDAFDEPDGALWLVFADEGVSLARLLYATAAGGGAGAGGATLLAPAPFFVRLHTARVGARVFREVAAQLAGALGALAGAGVAAHRDVKPGNALVGADAAGGLRVVLCDLGSALPAEPDAVAALYPPPAAASAAEATLAYAPPEVRLSLDGRAVGGGAPPAAYDSWSLGVTLLEVLLGAPPGQALAAGAVLGERDAAGVRARLDAELGPDSEGAGGGEGGASGAPAREGEGAAAAASSGGWAPLRPRAAAGVLVDLLALCVGPRVPPGADAAEPPDGLPRAAAAAWPAAVRALAAAGRGRAWDAACLDDPRAFGARVRRVVARAQAAARAAAAAERARARGAEHGGGGGGGGGRSSSRGDGGGESGQSDAGAGAVAVGGGSGAGGAGGEVAPGEGGGGGLALPDAVPAGALPPPPPPSPSQPLLRLAGAAAGRALVAAFGAAAGGERPLRLELAPPPSAPPAALALGGAGGEDGGEEGAEASVGPLGETGGGGGRRGGAGSRRRAAGAGSPAADGADGGAGGGGGGAWALGDEGEALLYGLLRWRAEDRTLPADAAASAYLSGGREARDDGAGADAAAGA